MNEYRNNPDDPGSEPEPINGPEWIESSTADPSGRPKSVIRSLLHEEARPYERYAIFGGYGLLALLVFTIVQGGPVHPVFPTAALVFFLYPFSKGVVTRRIIQCETG